MVNAASTPMLSWDTTAHLPFTAPEVVPLSHTLIRDRIEPSLKSVLKAEEQVGLIPTHVDVAIAFGSWALALAFEIGKSSVGSTISG